jgi:hypothetical protein
MEESTAAGRLPTRRELRAWRDVGGDVQLGFASLLVDAAVDRRAADALTRAVALERAALDALRRLLRDLPDPDTARVAALREIRDVHRHERVLVFSEHASTLRALYALMRADAGVGLLSARDARIASGRLPRAALLERFAPHAQGAREPAERERVTVLLTTDLLSEGVNLQDASVVVHVDLPWNPARLAQRVGRVRRPGGASVVHTYLLAPPANAELLLDIERRLRRKLATAERMIGRSLHVIPMLAGCERSMIESSQDEHAVSATMYGEMADRVARWRSDSPCQELALPLVAGAVADRSGWLAAIDDGRLIASLDGRAPDDAASVLAVVPLADGEPRPLAAGEAETTLREAERWLDAEDLARSCGISGARTHLDDCLERRIAQAVHDAPRHQRADVVSLARRLRNAMRLSRSLGAEHELASLLVEPFLSRDSAAWLALALRIAERSAARPTHGGGALAALVIFGPCRAL